MNFAGVHTAIVTPFRGGAVDFDALRSLVERQIAAGVAGLVPVGTTGESPTLPTDEHLKVIEVVVEAARRRVMVIAGTGANSTQEALELTAEAKRIGADATLQVCPYYNKPSQEGLYRHFAKVADDIGLPVVLYNVPGRCGVEIAPETIAKLARNANVVALKEAGGRPERVSAVRELCPLPVLSGDDSLTLPMLSLGAVGVVSVASNLCPALVVEMVSAALAGRFADALRLHDRLYPLFRDLFVESNPGPIKAAMAMRGLIAEEYRLPLCPISEASRAKLRAAMEKAGV